MNTTDPDTRYETRRRQVGAGYNVQVVASPEQIILAAQVTQALNDGDQLEPMVTQTAAEPPAPASRSRSAPCWHGATGTQQRSAKVRAGQIEVLIPTKSRKRTKPRQNAPPQSEEARRVESVRHA